MSIVCHRGHRGHREFLENNKIYNLRF